MRNRTLIGSLVALAVASMMSAGATIAAPESPSSRPTSITSASFMKKDGWWIKVRKKKQESPTITLSIGAKKDTVEPWKTWNTGEDLEFDVPEKFTNVKELYIKAQSSGDKKSWFCMMYKGDGVQHFDFNNDEEHQQKQDDRDSECKFDNDAPVVLLSQQLSGPGR